MSHPAAASAATGFPLFRLLVISGAIFASVTSEFLPTGLLPEMARDLGVTESQIGLLVTAFALTVVVSTAPLTVLTRNISRKWLMVALLGVFAFSNVLGALAPSYEFLMATRVLGGLAHGLFWAVTSPYASHLVSPRQLSRAVSVTSAGVSAAFILGVPVGTALGLAFGWRVALLVIAAVIVVFALLVAVFLPPVSHRVPVVTGEIPIPIRGESSLRPVLLVCLLVLLLMLGQNVFYAYIAPWTIQVAGFDEGAVGGILFACGVAGAVGLLLAGFFGDRYPRATPALMIVGVIVSVSALALVSGTDWAVLAMVVAWSVAFGGLPALLHARMLRQAAPRLRDIGAAGLTTSFNIAIGGGAFLGGVLLDAWGLTVLPWVLVALLLLVLVVEVFTGHAAARRDATKQLASQITAATVPGSPGTLGTPGTGSVSTVGQQP